jgi:hypothetical protein
MKHSKIIILVFIFYASSLYSGLAQETQYSYPPQKIEIFSDSINWEIPQLNLKNILKFSELEALGTFNNDVQKGQNYSFVINTGKIRKEFKISNSQKLIVPLLFTRADVTKELDLIFWPDRSTALFSDTYTKIHENFISYEVPDVYELANIVLSIAIGEKDNNYPVDFESDYAKDVQNQFGKFNKHPLIMHIKESFEKNGTLAFYSLIADSYGYNFNASGELKEKSEYQYLGTRTSLRDSISLWEDFARKSDFHNFFEQHRKMYTDVSDELKSFVLFENARNWIENNFDKRKYSIKFVASPLSIFFTFLNFHQSNLTETLFFGCGLNNSSYKNVNKKTAQFLYTKNYFISVLKNYFSLINKPDSIKINDMFGDFDAWAEVGMESYNYKNGQELFDEYLVNACFLLFAKDYSEDDYKVIKFFTDRNMKKRGFKQFDNFTRIFRNYINQEVIRQEK